MIQQPVEKKVTPQNGLHKLILRCSHNACETDGCADHEHRDPEVPHTIPDIGARSCRVCALLRVKEVRKVGDAAWEHEARESKEDSTRHDERKTACILAHRRRTRPESSPEC